MGKIRFNTPYDIKTEVKALPVGPRICDTTGYLSPNVRIEGMIAAGERLVEFRDDQAMILDELYADERALPYNPTELQMLEINSLTSKSAQRALERIREYLSLQEAQRAATDAERPSEGKNSAPSGASNEADEPPKKGS